MSGFNLRIEVHSLALSDSTISNFLILPENIRLTSIERKNVIEADNNTFVIVNEGIT